MYSGTLQTTLWKNWTLCRRRCRLGVGDHVTMSQHTEEDLYSVFWIERVAEAGFSEKSALTYPHCILGYAEDRSVYCVVLTFVC